MGHPTKSEGFCGDPERWLRWRVRFSPVRIGRLAVGVVLHRAPGKRENEPGWYRRRMWIEEMLRDLKGQGFGLDRHRWRRVERLRGWLWLLALGMVLLVLLGATLRGERWGHPTKSKDFVGTPTGVVAYPKRQSLFRLAQLVLAQGPPPWPVVAVQVLDEILSVFPLREKGAQLRQGGGKG